MFEKAVKRVTKGLLWRARSYIRRLDEEVEQNHNDDDHHDYAYPRLNSILIKLLSERRGVLRSNYTWGVLHGVYLAKTLGIKRVSVIEFGVAGGA